MRIIGQSDRLYHSGVLFRVQLRRQVDNPERLLCDPDWPDRVLERVCARTASEVLHEKLAFRI